MDANGQTALHIAVISRSLEAVQLLIRGNRHIINAVNNNGQTPLFIAIQVRNGCLPCFLTGDHLFFSHM